jgi:ABC-type glycerol-3-phosphate transport system substrate-binding protein
MMRKLGFLLVLATHLLTACSGSAAAPTSTPVNTASAQATQTRTPASTGQAVMGEFTLWLPPFLDSGADTPGSTLFAARLQQFLDERPSLTLNVRIKEQSGPAGLLEALSATSLAAPAALPDIILLDAASINASALKGLIQPLGALLPWTSTTQWYGHAIPPMLPGEQIYGLPMGSAADVLAYRISAYAAPPTSWADLLNSVGVFLFPAADPTATFTLAQYASLQGALSDEAGRPSLEATKFAEVLSFYASLRSAGILPLSSLQNSSPSQSWNAMLAGKAASAMAPLDEFLAKYNPATTSALALPTHNGEGVLYADGWYWAIVTADPSRQELAGALLEWLSAPDFVGPLTYALGLLPPTPAAFTMWPDERSTGIVSQLLDAALPAPSAETLAIFGPIMQSAVEAVLRGTLSPQEAADAAAQAVQNP